MLLHDLDDLLDAVDPDLLERASVLATPEPLVLQPTGRSRTNGDRIAEAARRLRRVPTVTVLDSDPELVPPELAAAFDVCLTGATEPPRPWVTGRIDPIRDAVEAHPEAALALVNLLRRVDPSDVHGAIDAEAATYALLLGSADHRRWLDARGPARPRPTDGPPVVIHRDDDALTVTLARPEARNAIDTAVRDALIEALALPLVDPGITSVSLSGEGPDFCSGGDLREFGTVADPATAFAVRLVRHPGRAAHLVADRLTARLHGRCIGAGIEVPAFAGRVIADPGTTVGLPELSMGLIPGAGGTVSVRRRIGRHRTAWMALTGDPIGATTAADWGLVDVIEPIA